MRVKCLYYDGIETTRVSDTQGAYTREYTHT